MIIKKRIYFILGNKRFIAIFLTFSLLFHLLPCKSQATNNVSNGVKKVVIDPGHGGKDPGASGKHSKEKDIVLAVTLLLRDYIEAEYKDVKVILTRDTDKFVALHKRAELANIKKADLFISIHANANLKVNAYGAETYAMGLHTDAKNLEVAKKENAVITLEKDYKTHYEGFDPNSAESYIIFNLLQNTYLNQSLNFASYVQEEIFKNAKRYNRGVKQAGFLVLWRTTMPSVLVEIGFMSNEKEERYMQSASGQKMLAYSIFKAFQEYKNVIERQSGIKPADDPETKIKVDTNNNVNPFLYKPKEKTTTSKPARASSASGKSKNIEFKVQVTASGKKIPLNSDVFKGFDNVEEFQVSSIYKYAVGSKYTYTEILKYSKSVKKHFPDAFIIAVKGKNIISVKEAISEIQEK